MRCPDCRRGDDSDDGNEVGDEVELVEVGDEGELNDEAACLPKLHLGKASVAPATLG